jgi:hypothetical protein
VLDEEVLLATIAVGHERPAGNAREVEVPSAASNKRWPASSEDPGIPAASVHTTFPWSSSLRTKLGVARLSMKPLTIAPPDGNASLTRVLF